MKTLLLIEDHKEYLNALIDTFREHGFTRIFPAERFDIASRILQVERIDYVVSDYLVPDGDGIEFLLDLRKKYPKMPMALLTAFSASLSKVQLAKLRYENIVVKNKEEFEFGQVLQFIETLDLAAAQKDILKFISSPPIWVQNIQSSFHMPAFKRIAAYSSSLGLTMAFISVIFFIAIAAVSQQNWAVAIPGFLFAVFLGLLTITWVVLALLRFLDEKP